MRFILLSELAFDWALDGILIDDVKLDITKLLSANYRFELASTVTQV